MCQSLGIQWFSLWSANRKTDKETDTHKWTISKILPLPVMWDKSMRAEMILHFVTSSPMSTYIIEQMPKAKIFLVDHIFIFQWIHFISVWETCCRIGPVYPFKGSLEHPGIAMHPNTSPMHR